MQKMCVPINISVCVTILRISTPTILHIPLTLFSYKIVTCGSSSTLIQTMLCQTLFFIVIKKKLFIYSMIKTNEWFSIHIYLTKYTVSIATKSTIASVRQLEHLYHLSLLNPLKVKIRKLLDIARNCHVKISRPCNS